MKLSDGIKLPGKTAHLHVSARCRELEGKLTLVLRYRAFEDNHGMEVVRKGVDGLE